MTDRSRRQVDSADKYDETQRRYFQSPKGKKAIKKYLQSDKGKVSLRGYYRRKKQKEEVLEQCLQFLASNPGKTIEDFLKETPEEER